MTETDPNETLGKIRVLAQSLRESPYTHSALDRAYELEQHVTALDELACRGSLPDEWADAHKNSG